MKFQSSLHRNLEADLSQATDKTAAATVFLPLVPAVLLAGVAASLNYLGPFFKLFIYSFTVLSILGTS